MIKRPVEILLKEFMRPLSISTYRLALLLRVTNHRLYEILNGRRRISAEIALRLAKCFNTPAQFWMNLQTEYELNQAKEKWETQIDSEVTTIPGTTRGADYNKTLEMLTDEARNVYSIIAASDNQICFDSIFYHVVVEGTNMPVRKLSAILMELEFTNLIVRVPGDSYIKGYRHKFISSTP